MKITKITPIPIKLQLKEPFVLADVTNYDMYYVIVRIETDNGIVGYGEATPAWEVTGETARSVIGIIDLFQNKSLLGYSLVGKDISSWDCILALIAEINPTEKTPLIQGNPSAKAALEQALLDVYAQHTQKPIYKLFKGKKCSIPTTETIGIFNIETSLQKISQAIRNNHSVIRLKIGMKKWGKMNNYERDIEVVKQARFLIEKSKKKTLLVADANQGFIDVDTTVSFCKKINNSLDWLEQPILSTDIFGFKKIKQMTDTPLMADESVHTYQDAVLLTKIGGVDFLNIKLMKTGGIVAAQKIIDFAEENGIKCQIGSMLESMLGVSYGCHLYASRQNVVSTDLQVFDWLQNQICSGIILKKNMIHLSSGYGNLVDLNKKKISQFKVLL